MYAFTALTTVALLSSLAAAQIPGLPSCAASCVGDSFGSCGSLDVQCICSSTDLIDGLSCCVSTACSQADQEATLQFANSLCAGQGVNNLPTAATCAGSASSTAASSTASESGSGSSSAAAATGSSTSSASSEGSSSTTSVASDETTVLSGSSTASSTGTSSTESETGSSSATDTPAESTGGAEALMGGLGSAGLGVVLAGVAAVL